ncbi:MAG: 7-cyano-7-deazaguanine synthase [Methanobacterium sp.]|jgi:predicted subunit of tRNA(5-methylaminomethyl-2-thiouridylate) methyltransferase|nr:7-cyano-7-deazaguanine synthase [Methanobacterium sp.]
MKACVLYSGGKDSSLMGAILQKLGYEVELVTVNFGCYPSWKPAAESASKLGFSHQVFHAENEILENAVDIILKEGYPNHGINNLHQQALILASQKYPVIADGIRRDDRVPKLETSMIQSLEDKKNVQYINLTGFGHKTIDQLSQKFFKIKKELTTIDNNSDYEIEIRYYIDKLRGDGTASSIFPEHQQSRVIGWRENE